MPAAAIVADLDRIFFVVGRGRSGTTLLSRMLTRNPALEVAPEGFFVMNLVRTYGAGAWSPTRVDAFCRDLVGENRMRTWQLDLSDIRKRLLAALPDLTFARACTEVYVSYAEVTAGRSGIVRVGDKNPHYGLFADRLIELFPRARFVHIVRDPRDNVLSYQGVPFDLAEPAALAYRWARYNGELLAVASRHPGSFHRVHYEQLIEQPEATLSGVCEFLGVPFSQAMLKFFEHAPKSFYGEGSAWFEKLGTPLDRAQAHKWDGAMPPEVVRLVEEVAHDMMERLGYRRTRRPMRLPPAARFQVGVGWASVEAERAIFGVLPAAPRIWFINTYRSRSGRV